MKLIRLPNGYVVYPTALANENFPPESLIYFESTEVRGLIGNPYFKEFDANDLYDSWKYGSSKYKPRTRSNWTLREIDLRRTLVSQYAWAVPTPEVIEQLKALLPIYEIGCGSGYWARMVTEAWEHEDYYAYDDFSSHGFTHFYHKIQDAPLDNMGRFKTLFLCWPSYDDRFAADALEQLNPETVVYVGEGSGGCTACDKFHEILDEKYEQVQQIEIPNYNGLHDWFNVYKRRIK